mmetsp:Transcript_30532/g.42279  ORF Transcript_30532/g.42279 Transcript_30532/m.42279 type:complete len:420 (-) Transcript_30532:99-1358(-)|eukprot:CAMPEP_0196583826 /NCGR_PEP_ID=MMETSP1081-20130531/44846_1 /TAXON_ID=36882 /ORGANISM="Pyramimonas amylifera, Strain CCMP720" /LENGTH=419 /DNA_ID=CAMNT_0041904843 /DNA_START=171 /DNA_END=1430 /DNA_ORIENTATION=-
MHITISTEDDNLFSLDMDENETIENLKAVLEVETFIPLGQQRLLGAGKELINTATLKDSGISSGDVIMLINGGAPPSRNSTPPAQNPLAQNPDGSAIDPIAFRLAVRNNPQLMSQFAQTVPALAEVILEEGPDTSRLQEILKRLHEHQMAERQNQMKMLELQRRIDADPMDIEAQREVAALIEQNNINENYENAVEYSPEVFAQVQMLYVDMVVNGVHLKAFVDSGAQSTIMSAACAERCSIMRLVDKRFAGIAKGVGTSKIIGRVHQAPLVVSGHHLTASVTVLENQDMEFLFGLDMLKRHHCCIDLKNNVLTFGSIDASVPFLGDGDLPLHLRGLESDPEEHAGETSGQGQSEVSTTAPPTGVVAPSGENPPTQGLEADMEVKIATLVGLGFVREQAIQALNATGGDVDQSASLLFS